MLMPGDSRAKSNPLSLIYRRLRQEERNGPQRADVTSLSASDSFFLAHLPHRQKLQMSNENLWRFCLCRSDKLQQDMLC